MTNLIYRQHMLDHAKNPRNMGIINDASALVKSINRSCGDELTIYLKQENGKIVDFKYNGSGCAVSISSASMISEEIIGKNIDYLKNLTEQEVLQNFGTDLTLTRKQCALLIYKGIKELILKI